MRKILWMIMTGVSCFASPVHAQFNTVMAVPVRYKVVPASSRGGRGRAFARNGFRMGHADRRHGSVAGRCTQKGMGGPLSQRELSATTDKDKFVLRLPERPVQREKEVPRWYRPARAGRRGAVHDGGCGREGRAGQGIRQVCHPAARQLHGQLLPPLEGTRRQRGGSPSA